MPRPPRSRLRRLIVGLSVSTTTLIILLVALEIVARIFLVKEVRSFGPVYTVDKLAGYRLRPNLSEYAFGADVETNSLGRRGPEWQREKPEGVFRIALIGDSLAFGFGVAFPETVGEVLAQQIARHSGRRCTVLNFAAPGYNSRQELKILRDEALAFAPDLVVVLTCPNDHQDALWVDQQGYLHWGTPGTKDSRVESSDLPRAEKWGALRHSALLTWARLAWSRHKAGQKQEQKQPAADWLDELPPGDTSPELRRTVLEPLLEMAKLCQQHDTPLIMAAFATEPDYRRLIAEFRRASDRPTLELARLFPEVRNWPAYVKRFSLGWDSHPNAEAHARWAAGLFAMMEQNRLLPQK